MTRTEKPCPMHVLSQGKTVYCEAGPDGHEGTHIGGKPPYQYEEELQAWKEENDKD